MPRPWQYPSLQAVPFPLRRLLWSAGVVFLPLAAAGPTPRTAPELAQPNDNRRPAGRLEAGVLTLDLDLRAARWRPEGPTGPELPVQLFAERGVAAAVPGPLIRVPTGTEIRLTLRNTLADSTLVVHGLQTRPALTDDSIVLAPGASRDLRFAAGSPGTYYYWGSTTGHSLDTREWLDSQLSGAIVIDSAGAVPNDRIFVLGIWSHLTIGADSAAADTGEVMTINGLAWPHTERFTVATGDSLRWRWVNPSASTHPMHLHGVYFEVTSRGDGLADTLYPRAQRGRVVTELMREGGTMTMRWAPARAGNWLFHCHFAAHVSPLASMDRGLQAMAHHRMAGLVLAIEATGRAKVPAGQARRLRLLVQSRADRAREGPAYGYVLQSGTEPAPDSVPRPSAPIVLTRGERVAITVVNRLTVPTSVHWHGIELESYSDGVPDLSGQSARLYRAIAPGDSFTARFTPPRAGTFIYHTHFDEEDQIARGLYGALIVLEPGARFDPATDHVVLVGMNGPFAVPDSVPALVNGAATPAPLLLAPGRTHRLRLVSIDAEHRLIFTLRENGATARWRAVAKDGADLPPALATERPAELMSGPGETADFEYRPGEGELRLDIAAPFAEVPWTVSLPIRTR